MRNLQKILALALALIMSFSLVVTANAAFSDEADISEAYNESVDVLSTLEVFKGYTDGTYQPQKSITRAEVAAIIYRIATGDVADEQVAIYSDWNRFTDVHAGEWWAGYINYCANAEYIKGYGNGKFGPDDPVTGYEALAMILRAVGYGKMDGEFQGSDWAVQTAARANGLKVTRNVQNSALLNSAATRELVAELLCKAMLVPTVEYNQYNGYTENDESLAKKNFGLEKIEGVVMANEYADLEDDDETLADGKTRLQMGDRAVTLNVTSTLDDIGETRYAYVKPTRNNDYDMVCSALFEEEGMNVVGETGAETKTKDLIKDTGLKDNGEKTLHYRNFDLANADYTSDWRLEFEVTFWNQLNDAGDTIVKSASNVKKDFEKDYADGYILQETKDTSVNSVGMKDESPATTPAIDKAQLKYTMVIKANDEITEQQLGVIRGIFAMADDDTHSLNVTGAVYAGSKSTDNNKGSSSSNNNRWNDLSDEMSYRTFYNEYISSKLTKIEGTTNGNTLKVIDNNNDGYVEYVLYTHYVLDEVVDSTTKGDKTTFYWDHLDTDEYEPAYIGEYEPTVGDIVIYAEIDGKAQMKLADSENATINAISYKDVSATSTEGKTYEQSDITNGTDMDQLVTAMDEKVEYVLYLDNYGYVRAYKLAQGNQYGLVTEVYPTHSYNSAYVKNTDLTVELMTKDDSSPKEHDVINSKDNALYVGNKDRMWAGEYCEDNWLERAQAHLGLDWDGLFNFTDKTTPDANEQDSERYSYTNVVKYNMNEDGDVNIYSAAQYAYDQDGKRMYYADGNPIYAVDYVQLEITDKVEKGAWKFPIDAGYGSYGNSNGYVNAVNDTEYYIVMGDTIKHIVGRANLPELKKVENGIRAMYAVAENTRSDKDTVDYWVANVIVIELEEMDTKYESVSLGYFNFQKHSDQVKYLNTLNNEYAGYKLDIIPEGEDWKDQWSKFGFWGVKNTEKTDEADTVEAKLDRIGKPSVSRAGDYEKYNDNGIFVGVVERIEKLDRRGGYIVATKAKLVEEDGVNVITAGDKVKDAVKLEVTNSQIFAINEEKNINEALDINIIKGGEAAETDVRKGDIIIWVNDSDKDVAFVVNLTDEQTHANYDWDTPDWLWEQAAYIADEQGIKTDDTKSAYKTALDAYLAWTNGSTVLTPAQIIDLIKTAQNDKATNDTQKAELAEMLKALTEANTPNSIVSALEKAYGEWKPASLKNDAKEPALREALYKTAKAYIGSTATSALADTALAEAKTLAKREYETFVTNMTATGGKYKFEGIETASKAIVNADTKALANADGANSDVTAYESTHKAKYEEMKPWYDAARKLVLAYDVYVDAGFTGSTADMLAAYEGVQKNNIHNKILAAISDCGSETDYGFGNALNIDYRTAYTAVEVLWSDAKTVGTFTDAMKVNSSLATKYGVSNVDYSGLEGVAGEWQGNDVIKKEIIITLNDRAGIPEFAESDGAARNTLVLSWLGLDINGGGYIYGDGIEGNVQLAYEINRFGYTPVLLNYGNDDTLDETLWICFNYVGSAEYTYTATLKNKDGNAGTIALTVTKVAGGTDNTTPITSIVIKKSDKASTGNAEDSTVATITVTASDKLTAGTYEKDISTELGALANGDSIYAVVSIDGQTLTTAPILYVHS